MSTLPVESDPVAPPLDAAMPGIRIWHPTGFRSLEFHHGTTVRHPYPRHWHDEYLICAVTGGAGYLDYPGASHFTPRGTLFVVAPGEVHANVACEEGCSFRSVYVPVAVMRQVAERWSAGSFPVFPTVPITHAATIRSFLELHAVMDHLGASCMERGGLLLRFLSELIARHATEAVAPLPAGRESAAVRRAKEFLDEHYEDSVSLDDLARLTRLSPFYLHRSFCRQTGIPPHAYQMQVRIARAKMLLQQSLSLSEVALHAGFSDQSHFTRHFKRLVGVTPARYFNSKNVQDHPRLVD